MDKREQRSILARETVAIAARGHYITDGLEVDIRDDIASSVKRTESIYEKKTARLEQDFAPHPSAVKYELRNESTLAAILRLQAPEDSPLGVLNFASAKNPGGGFLNGSMAQEESLAVASNLYRSLQPYWDIYDINRDCGTFCYTDNAIWSPDVVFFRNDAGTLLCAPAKASVLTLPAVNYGQVLLKGENPEQAKVAMKRRMKIALAIFAEKGCKTIILGAYGCGVFRNDPSDVANWWYELLTEYGGHFDKVVFSILDRSKDRECLSAFERKWGKTDNG